MSFFDEARAASAGPADADAVRRAAFERIAAIMDQLRAKMHDPATEAELRARQKALGEAIGSTLGYLLFVFGLAPLLLKRAVNRSGLVEPITRRQARAILAAVGLVAWTAGSSGRRGQRDSDDLKEAIAKTKRGADRG